jgi:hypothetical protein
MTCLRGAEEQDRNVAISVESFNLIRMVVVGKTRTPFHGIRAFVSKHSESVIDRSIATPTITQHSRTILTMQREGPAVLPIRPENADALIR